jgi:hypothetical protein
MRVGECPGEKNLSQLVAGRRKLVFNPALRGKAFHFEEVQFPG